MDKETGSCISWNNSPILTQLANDRSRILTKAWFLNHCFIAFYVPSVMWTISLSMVFIIFSYSEDLWSPCFLKTQVLNSGLHWPLCLFLSTWGLGWGGGKGLPCDLPYPSLLWGLYSLCSASWIDFSSVLDLSKCFWASSSPMTLSQHFCWHWSGVSIYVHSSLLSDGVMLTPWECSEPLDSRLSVVVL